MDYVVSSGLVLSGISLTGNHMYVLSGGTADETAVNDAGSMSVDRGGTINATVINALGSVSLAGAANYTTVNGFGYRVPGEFSISDGGTASGTVVNSGGRVQVGDGGTAGETAVNDCGELFVTANGTVRSTTVNGGGGMHISSGGSADSTVVNSGGSLELLGGAAAAAIRENGGYVSVAGGAAAVFAANNIGELLLAENSASLHSGTTATSATVESYGRLYVYASGSAVGTDVNDGGDVHVSSGGAADWTVVNAGGDLFVSRGGAALSATVNAGGNFEVLSGGAALSATVNAGGAMYVFGTATETAVNGSADPDCGELYVCSGGAALSVTVNAGGWMSIDEGGTASGLLVGSGGELHISSGGMAAEIRENGGFVDAADGADATFAANEFSGLILSAASATLHSGTTATSAAVYGSGELYVFDGGTAKGTVLTGIDRRNCAELYVYGGAADSTVVNAGGWMYVVGAACSTVVGSDGYLGIARGGRHTGTLTVAEGAVVSADAGSIIDFDISTAAPESAAPVNDLSKISGAPDFSISVSAAQGNGTYRLADGAAGFDKTVTVRMTDDTVLGTLTVGETLSAAGKLYALAQTSGELSITVTGELRPEAIVGDFSGGSPQVLKYAPDGSLTLFDPLAGTATPIGNLDAARWDIRGVGNYSGVGAAEVLIQDLQTGDVRLVSNAAEGIDDEKAAQSLRLGIVSDGFGLAGVGNFNGSANPGVLLTAPEQVSPGYSKVTGLPCWALDDDFNMSPGWLGAMVTTWDGGIFTIDPADLTGADDAAINAKYYSFDLVGAGDFNGDGVDDVMIRNNMPMVAEGRTITGSGDVFVFLTGPDISGYQAVNVAYTGQAVDPWIVSGIGDFNGDGIDDVLLENTADGGVATWLLDNTAKCAAAAGIGYLAPGQNLVGTGDVDGDDTDDVLFSGADGKLYAWTVQDGAYKGLLALG